MPVPMKDMMGIPLLPINGAAHGDQIDAIIGFLHWFMVILFIGWFAFFLYCLIRFRKSKNPVASYDGVTSHAGTYLETGIVLVEIVLLFGFSIPLWAEWASEFPDEKDSVVVRVVAEQFAWNFHYTGPDGKFGKTDIKFLDVQSNPLGLDRKGDPDAKDDVVVKRLYLPKDKPAILHITSKDVIHGFGVPVMRLKQDAIPGQDIPMFFTPIITGKFLIACSQLCGIGHSTMRGFMEVWEQDKFDEWIAKESAAAVEESEGEESW